ncbi:uncharacterized protein Tco025E_08266 [Trypanosoma conorhini]|uniref:Uncharacterized protein n=1 Tax=Trypanosoma conorhini TaxID=83891 RepID=A0A3R7K7L5_9TRYP|nr:uncharacterized protein Tco025E_08266 [Trypanosoma conorhini]RNF03067.1 hypothetical protein Tco025E_08266 [Trypanosoma conorhini]
MLLGSSIMKFGFPLSVLRVRQAKEHSVGCVIHPHAQQRSVVLLRHRVDGRRRHESERSVRKVVRLVLPQFSHGPPRPRSIAAELHIPPLCLSLPPSLLLRSRRGTRPPTQSDPTCRTLYQEALSEGIGHLHTQFILKAASNAVQRPHHGLYLLQLLSQAHSDKAVGTSSLLRLQCNQLLRVAFVRQGTRCSVLLLT